MTSAEVGDVRNPGAIEVAACVGRIPEPVPTAVERPVRIDVEEAALRCRTSEMEVGIVVLTGRAVAVEDDEEWGRMVGVVSCRDDER